MADYLLLSEEEQDDIMATFLMSQERDHFCHQINLDRYDKMLQDLDEGDWKKRVTQLRKETVSRLDEVNSIIKATREALPKKERLEAAKLRVKAAELAQSV